MAGLNTAHCLSREVQLIQRTCTPLEQLLLQCVQTPDCSWAHFSQRGIIMLLYSPSSAFQWSQNASCGSPCDSTASCLLIKRWKIKKKRLKSVCKLYIYDLQSSNNTVYCVHYSRDPSPLQQLLLRTPPLLSAFSPERDHNAQFSSVQLQNLCFTQSYNKNYEGCADA